MFPRLRTLLTHLSRRPVPLTSSRLKISDLAPLPLYSLYILALASFINDHVAETISVRGPSMSPTLSALYHETGARDYVLLDKREGSVRLPSAGAGGSWGWSGRGLRRGDVVSFWAPTRAEELVVKRVVGIEGDWVRLDRRRGEEEGGFAAFHLAHKGSMDEVEKEEMGLLGVERRKGWVKIPQGHVWVEGDNWRRSRDSNYYGPISASLINGRAICLVSPFGKFGSRPWEEATFESGTRVEPGIV